MGSLASTSQATTAYRRERDGQKHSLERVAPGILALLGFGLFTFRIMRSGLSGDEAYGASLAVQGLGAVLDVTRTGEPHPPLYYALLSLWMPLAGDSEFSLRFLSVAAGTILISLVYHLGRLTIRGPAAILASAWAAVHPYHVWYAQEARMYLPLALFSTLSTTLFVHLLTRPRRKVAIGYATVTVLALYTHYYVVFLLAGQVGLALVVLLPHVRYTRGPGVIGMAHARDTLRVLAVAVAASALLYLPWLAAANQLVRSYNALGPTPLIGAITGTLTLFSTGYSGDSSAALPIGLFVAALASVGLAGLQGNTGGALRGRERLLFCGYALFPAVAAGLLSLARPAFAVRYLLVSDGAFLLLVGAGLGFVWQRQRGAGALATLGLLACSAWSLSSYYTDPRYVRSNYGDLVRYIVDHRQPDEGIVIAGLTQQSQFWYYYRHRFAGASPSYPLPSTEPLDPTRTLADLDRIAADHSGIWFVDTDTLRYDPGRLMEQHLTAHHYLALERWFGVNRLLYFVPHRSGEIQMQPVAARFDDRVRLEAAAVHPERVRPGEVVRVALEWQATGPLDTDLKVSVRLKDAGGHTMVAIDREPRNGFARTSTWRDGTTVRDNYGLAVPASILPGDYQVTVHLYDAATGRELVATDRNGQTTPSGVVVGQLTVADAPVGAVSELAPRIAAGVDFGPLRLVGASPPEGDLNVGQPSTVLLFWQPRGTVPAGTRIRLSLTDESRQAADSTVLSIVPTSFAPDDWTVGRVLAIPTDFVVPARASSGPHGLLLEVLDSNGQSLRAAPYELTQTYVHAPTRIYATPQPQHPTSHQFGSLARLVGYDLDDRVSIGLEPGDVLRVTLHWQAIGETDVSYKVFLHLVGPDGAIHGQRDAPPVGGTRLTTSWVSGEFVADPYEVELDRQAPPGRYVLHVGLYDEASGKRIALQGEPGDAINLFAFQVNE